MPKDNFFYTTYQENKFSIFYNQETNKTFRINETTGETWYLGKEPYSQKFIWVKILEKK